VVSLSNEGYKYSGRLTIRIPVSLHRELAESAAIQRVSMNQFVSLAIAGALERLREPPPKFDPFKAAFGPPTETNYDGIMGSLGYEDE
jgi:hypothetical protein